MGHILYRFYCLATIFELVLIITLLTIFTCTYREGYRTMLWEVGGIMGWNSDPRSRVYYYANYQEPPPVPLIWDEVWHRYHLYVAIVMAVIWIVRQRIQIHGLDLIGRLGTNVMYDLLLAALWTYSAIMQNSADVSDPAHFSLRPWYLVRGCDGVWDDSVRACQILRASFSLTIFTAIWCCLRALAVVMYGWHVLVVHSFACGWLDQEIYNF